MDRVASEIAAKLWVRFNGEYSEDHCWFYIRERFPAADLDFCQAIADRVELVMTAIENLC